MWLVGDEQTHAAYLAALAGSHGMRVTVKAYLDGAELGTVPVAAGSGGVKVDAGSRVRRTVDSLLVPEAYWPAHARDMLSPYGVRLRIWHTVTTGTYTFPPVPVFAGRVESVSRVRRSGLVRVVGLDPMAQVNDDAFEEIRPAPRGTRVTQAIADLIREVHPDAAVTDTTGSAVTVPAGVQWRDGDGSRGQAVDDLARSIGAEVLALPDATWLIRPLPSLSDPAVWTVATGPGGVLVRDAQSLSRTGVANRWVLIGEQAATTGDPVRVVVTDDDVTSPLRYGGPYGRVTRQVSSPLLATAAQAHAAGVAYRERVRGLARTRELEVVANPALEAGDVVEVTVATDGDREWHIADQFEVPLTVDPPTMSVATRSTEMP
ncbi:MAG TPA: DUF5047 domain-containing protein [Micromonosporaceae bacterium]|nr:DUF5047 domain-containing protein [Micromonosporaceae bacterium]